MGIDFNKREGRKICITKYNLKCMSMMWKRVGNC
jgi:hypothetical protein